MAAVDHTSKDQFFHGTRAKHLESIQSEGLRAPKGVNHLRWPMLTTSREQAAAYTAGHDDAVVLEYRLSPDEQKNHLASPIDHDVYGHAATAYSVREPLPGALLSSVDPVRHS